MNHKIFSLTIAAASLAFGAAQAAPSDDNQIRVAVSAQGLDLNSASGAWAFTQRIKVAAATVCRESRGIDDTRPPTACLKPAFARR